MSVWVVQLASPPLRILHIVPCTHPRTLAGVIELWLGPFEGVSLITYQLRIRTAYLQKTLHGITSISLSRGTSCMDWHSSTRVYSMSVQRLIHILKKIFLDLLKLRDCDACRHHEDRLVRPCLDVGSW